MTKLDKIERDIRQHRELAKRADEAGHSGEQEWHESEIDRLLSDWKRFAPPPSVVEQLIRDERQEQR